LGWQVIGVLEEIAGEVGERHDASVVVVIDIEDSESDSMSEGEASCFE
jgi:hypothetical protein